MSNTAVRVLGPLDFAVLQSSVEAVVERHESLRTRIITVDGEPQQQIGKYSESQLQAVDLSGVLSRNIFEYVNRLADEFIAEKVNLSVGPLFAVQLYRLSSHEHILILASEHMISDSESKDILKKEIWTLYSRAAQRLPCALPPLPVQFADYAVWQYRTFDAWLQKNEGYWKQRLGGATLLELPTDNAGQAHSPAGMRLQVPFGDKLSLGLRNLARRERVLLPVVVFTVYAVVLSRWCDQRDFILGFGWNGRSRPELANMIGWLAEGLPLRIEVLAEDSFFELLMRINLEFSAACDHQGFNRIPEIVPACATDVGFNWISSNWKATEVTDGAHNKIGIESYHFLRKPLPFRFGSFFSDSASGITWNVEYRPDLFLRSSLERFGRNLRMFAEEFTHRPSSRLASTAFRE